MMNDDQMIFQMKTQQINRTRKKVFFRFHQHEVNLYFCVGILRGLRFLKVKDVVFMLKNYTLSRCNIRIKKHTWIGLRWNDMLNMQIHTKNNILMFNHLIAFFSFFMTLKKWQHCKNKQRVLQKIYSLSII